MTRATFDDVVQRVALKSVSCNVNFLSKQFQNYSIGANNAMIGPKKHVEVPSLKEIVAKETTQLLEQKQRLSVRDLAKQFENGLAIATKLSHEAKWRGDASLDKYVLLKRLSDLLVTLRGRVVGQNKDEVDNAISMVEALAVQLTGSDGELFLEKELVNKLAIGLKKATIDAKRAVEEERSYACAVSKVAREAAKRVEHAFYEEEKKSMKQNLEELMKEVQVARRIKMLHQPSKVRDMERELKVLRVQLAEKSHYSIMLHKELAMNKRHHENKYNLYEFEGLESLGSCLRVISREDANEISNCSIQWYRVVQPDGNKKALISGATKRVYSSEPFDVGQFLLVEIVFNGERATLTTTGPIDPAAGLGSYVEALVRKPETEFNVVIMQMNGNEFLSKSIHIFHVGKLKLKLSSGKNTKVDEFYSSSMQLCGSRGGGNAASQSVFWKANSLSFTLAFESPRERNAAIMLARRFSFDCNIVLAGPGDR